MIPNDAVWAIAVGCVFLGAVACEAGQRFLDWTDRRRAARIRAAQAAAAPVAADMNLIGSIRIGEDVTLDADGIHVRPGAGLEWLSTDEPGDESTTVDPYVPPSQRERDDEEMRRWMHTAMTQETEPMWHWPLPDPPPPGMIDRTVARTRAADEERRG